MKQNRLEQKNYKAVLFDLDGTLANTIESLMVSCNLVLKEFGLRNFGEEDYKRFVGNGVRCLVERIFRAAGEEKYIEEGYRRFQEIFKEYAGYHVEFYNGMWETLQILKKHGIKIGVVTNKPHLNAIAVVEQLAGKGFFDVIQGQKESVPKKPDPAGALLAAKAVGVEPEDCLYLGDSDVDMMTGRSAGMFTVGALWGFRTREELVQYKAQGLAETPEDLLLFIQLNGTDA